RNERAHIIGAVLKADGKPVSIGGIEKMSKSKNNGVDPQTMVDKYGADTVRLFSMFAAPPEHSLEWSENGLVGMARFLRRLWNYCRQVIEQRRPPNGSDQNTVWDSTKADRETVTCRRLIHESVSQAIYDYQRKQFNTVISAAMKLLNT